MRMDRALTLLAQCTGDDLWSVDHCRAAGVPQEWIDSMADAFETSYQRDSDTIYVADTTRGQRVVHQYHGIRDVDLAVRIGRLLGVPVDSLAEVQPTRVSLVRAIKEAVMED